jgi:ABC-type multidrug transport system ATPase subunit
MDQVCKSFGAGVPGCGAKVRVLAAASLVVNAGEIVGIAGGPGSGKSTLLRCAAGMMRPEYGSVAWLATGSGSARAETHLPLYLDLRDTIPRGEIERAIASGARLLLVDHATPLLLDELRAAITRSQSLRLRGAIVIASRSSRELAMVASRVLVLSEGRLPGLS